MLTPEFLAASMIALGIGVSDESAARVRELLRGARAAAGLPAVRSRRGRRLRKRGIMPAREAPG